MLVDQLELEALRAGMCAHRSLALEGGASLILQSWRRFLEAVQRKLNLGGKRQGGSLRRRLTARLEVNALEDRLVPATVTNPVSAFPIVVDGQFTNSMIAIIIKRIDDRLQSGNSSSVAASDDCSCRQDAVR